MLGFAVTGSFCNFEKCLKTLDGLSKKYDEILPILSYNAYSTDTRLRDGGVLCFARRKAVLSRGGAYVNGRPNRSARR